MGTNIEWTETTWSPVIGCHKLTDGCKNCYAIDMARRLSNIGTTRSDYANIYSQQIHDWNGKVLFRRQELEKPEKWKKPRMVFVCSMSDIFYDRVETSWIEEIFLTMADNPKHTFQILTKRAHRMWYFFHYFSEKYKMFPENIWLGVTIENQKELIERLPYLKAVYPTVRFVSFEPLLGDVTVPWADCCFIDWWIIGPETGSKRRKCDNEWIKKLVLQAEYVQKKVFVKKIEVNGKISGDIDQFPRLLKSREYPI
jgi:protein gp37